MSEERLLPFLILIGPCKSRSIDFPLPSFPNYSNCSHLRYLLGYIPGDNRLYLGDKELNVVSFQLLLSVLEYQTAVMRRWVIKHNTQIITIGSNKLFAAILTPQTRCCQQYQRSKEPGWHISLRSKASKSRLLQSVVILSTGFLDLYCRQYWEFLIQRFDLAIQLGDLDTAYGLAKESGSEQKWKQLAELATSQAKFDLAQQCLHEAQVGAKIFSKVLDHFIFSNSHFYWQDHGGLLLLATAAGNAEMVGINNGLKDVLRAYFTKKKQEIDFDFPKVGKLGLGQG